jgi:hypothetical protein
MRRKDRVKMPENASTARAGSAWLSCNINRPASPVSLFSVLSFARFYNIILNLRDAN